MNSYSPASTGKADREAAALYQRLEIISKPVSDHVLESGLGAGIFIPVKLPQNTGYSMSPAPSTAKEAPRAANSLQHTEWASGEEPSFCMTKPGCIVKLPVVTENVFRTWTERESCVELMEKTRWPMTPEYPGPKMWMKNRQGVGRRMYGGDYRQASRDGHD